MIGSLKNLKNVAIALSGGVDSAVSAALLKQKGFNVTGVFMRNWDTYDDVNDACDHEKDAKDAEWICNKLEIPFKEVSFVQEYWSYVFEAMMKDYVEGLTPNPDILCNSYIKFNPFYHYCRDTLNADAIATGHYVRTTYGPFLENASTTSVKLLKGIDPGKDQSFFLSRVEQEVIQNTMFPVGELMKVDVKKMAEEESFHRILKKKESMGICFIKMKNFRKFMEQYVSDNNGDIINIENGEVIGKHRGIHFWTIGQQCNVIPNSEPFYVVRIDKGSNIVFVVQNHDHPALFTNGFIISNMHWIDKEPKCIDSKLHLYCKYRFMHGKPLADCHLIKVTDTEYLVDIETPVYCLAPGQFAVFYDGDECLGSGKIICTGVSNFSIKLNEVLKEESWPGKEKLRASEGPN